MIQFYDRAIQNAHAFGCGKTSAMKHSFSQFDDV